jgi:DNA invertase Pin-like site-specific DNA recombinase
VRLVGYLRVSTDRQAEDGSGLEVQERAVRAWCRANGHRLVAVLTDQGVSGATADRPALAEALAMVKAGGDHRAAGTTAEGLVVARLDRLARDLVLQEQLLAEVWRIGGQVCSAVPGEAAYLEHDPDDPSRALIRQILGAVAQYERSLIRLRLQAGLRRKAELGGYTGGVPRFGSRVERGDYVADADEQRTLARIVELRRAGRSLRSIGEALESEGLRPRSSTRWHPQVLSAILARPDIARRLRSKRLSSSQ